MTTQQNKKYEYRTADLAAADIDTGLNVTGYAAVFDAPTTVYHNDETGIDFKEVIDKGAFDSCDFSKCVFRYNHDDSYLALATTHNDTLRLTVDEKGLRVDAELADTTAGRDIFALIKRGDICKMSYAYAVSNAYFDEPTHTRHITAISAVIDVSAVDQPAYDATSLDIVKRSLKELHEEQERRAREKARISILSLY